MKNWKSIVYLACLIQVGAGISMVGVMSFLPLFLSEIGITDPGEAAFWAGLIVGITPFMIAFSAPFWSIQADRRGPKTVMSVVLLTVTASSLLQGFATSPWHLLFLRMAQGLVGGFVPIGLSIVVSVTPENKTSWSMGYFQAAMVMGIMFGPLLGGTIADTFGYRMPFFFFAFLAFCCFLAVRIFLPAIHRKGADKERASTMSQIFYFMKIPRVRLMTFMQFLCNFGITGIGPILPLYIKQMVGTDSELVATMVGFIIFISGGCSAVMSLNVGRLTEAIRPHRSGGLAGHYRSGHGAHCALHEYHHRPVCSSGKAGHCIRCGIQRVPHGQRGRSCVLRRPGPLSGLFLCFLVHRPGFPSGRRPDCLEFQEGMVRHCAGGWRQ